MKQNHDVQVPLKQILVIAFLVGLALWGLIFGVGRTLVRTVYPQVGETFIPGMSYWVETAILVLAGALFNTLLYYVNRIKLNRYK